VSNSIGRLTQVSSSATTNSTLSYDTMGRATATSQFTNGTTYPFSNYTYNRAGALTQMTYPSWRVVATGGFDALARPGSVSSGSTTYVSGIQYASHGAVKSLTLGNGLAETTSWNMARLQPASITAGGLWSANFYYCGSHAANGTANNGNLIEQDFTVQGTSYVQTYGYDALNRISAAGEVNASNGNSLDWSQSFGYDNFGNRAVTAASGNGTVNAVWTPTAISQFTSSNQFRRDPGPSGGDQYDLAGNQIAVASSASQPDVVANTMAYDAENRMVSANIGNTGAVNYTYDGDGRRVMKSIPATGDATVYAYDGAGQLAAEYSTAAPTVTGTMYLTVDHLGSTRLVTNAAGAAIRCADYMPFGEDVPAGVGSRGNCWGTGLYPASPDVVSEKFTGKERDAETGLDFFGARYMSSAQGRFTGPDPSRLSAFIDSPQSWNMYTYAYNNPFRFVDKNGKWPTAIHNQIIDAAFPNLTPGQRQILKDVSAHQDAILTGGTILGGQGSDQSPEHAMRAPGQSVADAEADYQNFVSTNEDAAAKAQISFWIAGNPGFSNDALKKFALALHAVLDSTSPAHAGFQVWDWRNYPQVRQHIRNENTITTQQLNNAVGAAQNAYNSTFFWAFGDPFVPSQQPQTPHVTEKICYTLDDGSQSCQ
jgi:RHS repeat-associated protein